MTSFQRDLSHFVTESFDIEAIKLGFLKSFHYETLAKESGVLNG